MDKDNIVVFTTDDNEQIRLCILEQTILNGTGYLLVCAEDEEDKEEAEVMIMKDSSAPGAEEAVYSFVVDEKELSAVAGIFSELLDEEDELIEE